MLSTVANEFDMETTQAAPLCVRKAAMRDIPEVLDLINSYAAQGVMLPRTEMELSENMRDFAVAFRGEKLMACGALHFYTPTMGEIRSLAVDQSIKSRGYGRSMVRFLLGEAAEYSLAAVFAFTYVPEFFARVGFEQVERGVLPLKVWKDCLRCSKFQSCDEIAVLRVLDVNRWQFPIDLRFNAGLLVKFPQIKK